MGSASANPERRHQRGWPSAWIAAARLMAWGYRILGQRVRTLDGTIDLVAVCALRLSLMVKRRTTRLDAVAARTADRLVYCSGRPVLQSAAAPPTAIISGGSDAVLREALHMTFPDLAKSR
ncbi:MAG TPA: hypothetical protein VFR73_06045 [Hyphomicrobiaceae bacterium]|nr:hypothetical protein [Hyphomicrobiaceae bacterium]